MRANLPFGALRTFESVARLRGFGRAAEELGVTQSAVSQHVKALEEWLGVRLLTRGGRAAPTDNGARLASAVAEGFGAVIRLCDELRENASEKRTIVLDCLPGFAFTWLIPRLIDFDQRHPEYPVSIDTGPAIADLIGEGSDVAIRYGLGNHAGFQVEKLLGERLFPVCAPGLLLHGPPLRTPADLAQHTMLYDEIADVGGSPPTWAYWAEQAGVVLPRPARVRRFGQSNMVVQAAQRGMGVALGREPLVADALADGRLVRPFAPVVESQFAYWLVLSPGALGRPRVRLLRDWLHEEAARQPPLTDASHAAAG